MHTWCFVSSVSTYWTILGAHLAHLQLFQLVVMLATTKLVSGSSCNLCAALQETTMESVVEGAEAAVVMLLLVAMGVMVVTTMVTMPMVEVGTGATTVATAALPQATMAMVAMAAMLLVVSLCTLVFAAIFWGA